MKAIVKDLGEIMTDKAIISSPWKGKAIVIDDNLTYLVWNEQSKEALVVDPMDDDTGALLKEADKLRDYRFIAVIDTHTHADHISSAADVATQLRAPLIQHELSPSRRIHLRVSRDTELPAAGGPLKLLVTPGHTPECITPIWGPFLFGGDMMLYGDTGRDDLPGGNPEAHWMSLQKIKGAAKPEMVMLPGHDGEGGRSSSWKTQLKENPALSQDKATFIADGGSYVGPSPKLLKESLYANFK